MGVTTLAEVDGIVPNTEFRMTPSLRELLLRIEGEYREMPGLSLTASQAGRLWGLDGSTCAFALTALVERRVLTQTTSGTSFEDPPRSRLWPLAVWQEIVRRADRLSEKEPQPS